MKGDTLCTAALVSWIVMPTVERTQGSCRVVFIKDVKIQLLTHSVTVTQPDLYLQRTNDSFTFTPFIAQNNHFPIPITLSFSHIRAPSHPPLSSTQPQHSDLPHLVLIGLSEGRMGIQTMWLDYAGKSWGNPSHPLCSQQNMRILFPQSCLPVASDKNMVK